MDLRIDSASAMQMAQTIFGSGISIVSASYSGQSNQVGVYSGALTTIPGIAPSDSGLILSTGRVDDFTQASGDANISDSTSTNYGKAGDAMLDQVSGQKTYDAAVFSATFVPTGKVLTMQIVFSSDEYLEYVRSGYNDAVAIWVNGVPATLAVGDGDITIDNINPWSNENLYVDNPAAANTHNTEMDGFTVTLTLKAAVKPGVQNTFRLAIADAGDGAYDSTVLVAADSVQVALVAQDETLTVHKARSGSVDVLANDSSTAAGALTVTKVNGVAVTVGSKVVLPTGDVITVGKGGVLTVDAAGHSDTHVLTYEVKDSAGNTDVAFVTLNVVACFTLGTLIAVPDGEVAVEALTPGDLVLTRDHGAQPLRWVGRATRAAVGPDAPVAIAAGRFGPHRAVMLSPNHRVMIGGPRAELLFAEPEVMVKARHLVDGQGVRRIEGGMVTYLHLLFDRHEVVMANGLPCESYYPGPATMGGYDAETQAEVLRLFPALAQGKPIGPLARPEVTGREARALVA
ncbi:choice-of-anchor L domain-containing protein [Paragemmobacter straminiformis]|uniref:Hint domain-containing protein n=1 Tax=Paragemmobacter straminiformis TaxID=2045119 RepID=A0A842ID36_9RHOB|nr:choice-of-anchor L domain-containing protein [Gemmobacter straminiformis]MBC2837545.1 Hint domain-containing protein [Gemmobacter straminiformis]